MEVRVRAFEVPTEKPERDGTLEWNSTKLVCVELRDGSHSGLGYTYADEATAHFIVEHALPILIKGSATDHFFLTSEIKKKSRNCGNAGVSSMALSAIDVALWDLRARKLEISVQDLLGQKRKSVTFYGSGLFINSSFDELQREVEYFKARGMRSFKMKIGSGLERDLERVKIVRDLIGEEANLFVDANGFYDVRSALALASELEEFNVSWFEEPVTSDDPNGMKFLRERFPSNLSYVAGEYCNQNHDFLALLQNGLVDILQADATRAEGVTGTLEASHLSHAFNVPFSTHCAPLLHGNIGICLDQLMIAEGFFDHLVLEEEMFDHEGGFTDGAFTPSPTQKGFGWKLSDRAKGYTIYEHTS